MKFRTEVSIDKPRFGITPLQRMLFVGSCFADSMGKRFVDDKFRAVVNPYGVMYNPVSILHTVERYTRELASDSGTVPAALAPQTCVLTLGTNHVYRLKETGEIVDNCRKRPQALFSEEELSVEECCDALSQSVDKLKHVNPEVKVIVTVSPIRYAKYGFHGSQLSKAVLLLAADRLARRYACVDYFPAYEIVNDELRDYRFYREDMLHPSEQAVTFIWQRFSEAYFTPETEQFLSKWRPIKDALNHRPFNPDAEEYRNFMQRTRERLQALKEEYPQLEA